MKRWIFLLCVWVIIADQVSGQEQAKIESESNVDSVSSNKMVLFPLVFYLPETSVGFGGAGAYTFRWKDQSEKANPSQAQLVATYTLQNQILLYLPYKIYLGENDYYIFGELGYYKYFYRFYGLGQASAGDQVEIYRANYPRMTLNVTRQFIPKWFGGVSFWYDNFDMRSFEMDGQLLRDNISGIAGGAVLGLGARLIHDTRKGIFYPTDGFYGEVTFLQHGKSIGSRYEYAAVDINASKYISINEKSVLALNVVSRATSGDVPFYHLAFHGGPRNGRGYELGRFRDDFMVTFNAEWRQIIKGRFGAVAFINYGGVGPSLSKINLSTFLPAAGLGLRYALDKENHLNVRLDYGVGKNSSEFYITVGEAF